MTSGPKKRLNLHDVIMYVAVARKHLRLMVLIMCLMLMGGLAYYTYARPVYYSKSLVRLDYVPLPLDTDKIYHDGRIAVVVNEFRAPHIIERTARKLGVNAT